MIRHGAVITKIHWGAKFSEAVLFDSFASNNIKGRYSTDNSKLVRQTKKSMNNNFVGKLLSVSSDYPNTKLLSNSVDAVELIRKDSFLSFDILNNKSNNKCYYRTTKISATDINLRLIALAILSNSKQRCFEFYYDHLKMKFGSKIQVCFCHTDAIIAELDLPRDEYLRGLFEISSIFDFSSLPVSHYLQDDSKKVSPGFSKYNRNTFWSFITQGQHLILYSSTPNMERMM